MINRIIIENFKSIKNIDLELSQINILIGANGAGKSNFIGFFKLLNKIYNSELGQYVASEGFANEILHFGIKKSEYLKGLLEFDSTNGYVFLLRPNNAGQLYFDVEHITFNLERGDYGGKGFKEELIGQNILESNLCINKTGIGHFVNQYMQSFKVFHFHDTTSKSPIRQACNINDNIYLKEDASNLAAFLYLLQEKHPKEFSKIELTIKSVAPYFEKFQLQPNRLNPENIKLEWKELNSESYFNSSHLSDGTIRFIALTTLLLQPNPPKVIIIDEPELGLHPFAIYKLAGLIDKASAKSQIIISTQSSDLIDNFDPENIITVDRKNSQSIFQRQNSENLKEWLENYSISEIWDKNIIGGQP